jgi:hypothetical protein
MTTMPTAFVSTMTMAAAHPSVHIPIPIHRPVHVAIAVLAHRAAGWNYGRATKQ